MHKRLHVRTISRHGAAKCRKGQDEDQGRDHEDHCGLGAQSTTTAEVSHQARDAIYRNFVVYKHRSEGVERDRFRLHTCGHVCAEDPPRQTNELSVGLLVFKSSGLLVFWSSGLLVCQAQLTVLEVLARLCLPPHHLSVVVQKFGKVPKNLQRPSKHQSLSRP